MTQKNKPAAYPSELRKPVVAKFRGILHFITTVGPEPTLQNYNRAKDTEQRRIDQALADRMQVLAKHYGRTWPEHAADLVWDLARAHVPGFQVIERPPKRGRKRTWTPTRLEELARVVDEVKRTRRLSDRDACKFIAKNADYRTDWGQPPGHRGLPSAWCRTLESRLQDARRKKREWSGLQKRR